MGIVYVYSVHVLQQLLRFDASVKVEDESRKLILIQ